MRLLPTLAAIPLVLASAQQPLQIYLHPTPTDLASGSAPTLSPDQARAVLAHHLGENIGDFEEIPNDEGLWAHLMGMWDGRHGAGENGGMGGKARVVIVDGGVDAQDVLPTSLPTEPSFYLHDSSSTMDLLEPYLNQASHFLQDIVDSVPALAKAFKDTFELAGSKAAAILGHELSCLTALADAIPWVDTSKSSWNAINISGLKNVDKDSEVWETGTKGVKAGLESMTMPDSPPLLLIIRSSPQTHTYGKRSESTRLDALKSNTTLADTCYKSNDTCSSSTSCNGRGSCALKGKNGDDECWGCKCATGYAGVECQKDDYSVPFAIIVFSTVFLMFTAGGAVMLLMTIGDTKLPSTLNLAIGNNMKRD